MVSMLNPRPGRILDNGCGVGIIAQFYPQLSARIVGVDLGRNMCVEARKGMSSVVQGDSQNLPFEDHAFSAVVSRSLLHHLPDPERGVKEIYRVLEPGGELIISDTLKSFVNTPVRFFMNRFSKRFSSHHKNFSKSYIHAILDPYFEIEKAQPFGIIAYPILGFPDIIDLAGSSFFSEKMCRRLIRLDEWLSGLAIFHPFLWGIILKGRRRNK